MIEEIKKILKLNIKSEKNSVKKIKYENSNMIVSLLNTINFN